jgi:hypothetical protein
MGGYESVSRMLKPGRRLDARHLIHHLEFQVPLEPVIWSWPAEKRERLNLHLVLAR